MEIILVKNILEMNFFFIKNNFNKNASEIILL